ncbi:MAG: class I SAM-dependent methyltransferase, partial [Actinomycetota bacterium]|nr:class I SAM-dependent methyltransferase [Actinomycetota bacterium]
MLADLHAHLYGTVPAGAVLRRLLKRGDSVFWEWYESRYEAAYNRRPTTRELVERCASGQPKACAEFEQQYVFGDADAGSPTVREPSARERSSGSGITLPCVGDEPEIRYDGISDWYDDFAVPSRDWSVPDLLRLVGHGAGVCIDVGCGTGLYAEALRGTGRSVIGVDLSFDQVRLAHARGSVVCQGSGDRLPVRDACVELVTAIWISNDIGHMAAVAREASRVLAPGGRLVIFGAHPCFNGPGVEKRQDGVLLVHPVYRHAEWHTPAPWWGPSGIRSKVGMRHVPL